MDRTYKLKHSANKGKLKAVAQTIKAYRVLAAIISSAQWVQFYQRGKFNKNHNIKQLPDLLSERYKQTCQYQVVGALKSFLSNRQNEFITRVHRSGLDKDSKHRLFTINKYELWHNKYPFTMVFINKKQSKKGKRVSTSEYTVKQGLRIGQEDLKLSRKILKHVLSGHRRPSFARINMALDSKVAVVSPRETGKAKAFEYWVRMSTCQKNKPVYLPIQTNEYFEGIEGDRKNFCQVNLDEKGSISVSFIKDVPDQKETYVALTDTTWVDIGLVTAMATNRGDLFGRDFMDRLLYYDNRITPLAANRQRQGLSVRSPRYDRRVNELRQYLKNEINRLLNRVMTIYNPAEIVIEKLDFRNQKLSKRMNRLLSRFGKSYIEAKLNALAEEFGIVIRYENPAYTSQECSVCGYVDKNNRKNQEEFECKFCHSVLHADVNATRNLKRRSSLFTQIALYTSKADILRLLTKRFVDFLSDTERKFHLRHSTAVSLLSANPYFAGTLAQLKGS